MLNYTDDPSPLYNILENNQRKLSKDYKKQQKKK